jgi:RNA polymerase sigma-70 factor, ECF subfamily
MIPNPQAGCSEGIVLERPDGTVRIADRDERFERCFREHYPRVLAYGLRRLPSRTAAEDVAAETFLVAWRRRDALPDDALPWLLGIARHVIHNERRSARRRARLEARLLAQPGRVAPAAADTAPVGSAGVLDALGRLGERDREVLLLTTWDGLDHRRAAAVLGCSRGAFAVRLHRARNRLARAMNDLALAADTKEMS